MSKYCARQEGVPTFVTLSARRELLREIRLFWFGVVATDQLDDSGCL